MELKRNDLAYNSTLFVTSSIVNSFYRPVFTGLENIPSNGPVLLLPKHQKYMDIPIEAELLRRISRKGNWIMKGSLPRAFSLVGGIGIQRKKDMKLLDDRQEKRRQIEQARQQREFVESYCRFLYENGEVVVMHPEGTRYYGFVGGPLKMGFVRQAVELTRTLEREIPLIPVGINYDGKMVQVKIGEPISKEEGDLESIIKSNLSTLSNLN